MRRHPGLTFAFLLLNLLLAAMFVIRERQPEIVAFERETVMQNAFDMLDPSHTGRLLPPQLPHVYADVFQRYDVDRNGYWTVAEFASAVESEGLPRGPKGTRGPRAAAP